jgi:ABC-type bacteriocin/lantibiotic exporter with double-glycine peptidase domain
MGQRRARRNADHQSGPDVIDLFFTVVFLAVMFVYSQLLTFVVLGAFPFYFAISAGATPLFRFRLDEKLARGVARNIPQAEHPKNSPAHRAASCSSQRRWHLRLDCHRLKRRSHSRPGRAGSRRA